MGYAWLQVNVDTAPVDRGKFPQRHEARESTIPTTIPTFDNIAFRRTIPTTILTFDKGDPTTAGQI